MPQRHTYGGQAVIEGVLIRGRRFISLAVRRQNSEIFTECKPINPIYSSLLRKLPIIRGVLVLIETLIMGIQALNRSAAIAIEDQLDPGESGIPGWMTAGSFLLAIIVGIGIFFISPLFAARALDDYISSSIISNLIEGIIRLSFVVVYISLIGLMKDIKRVFSYHGAEHMVVHTHEAGMPLTIENARRFPTAHPRCGTAFLLTVMVIAIIVFSLIGRPSMVWSIASRVALLPLIAGISYEIIRFTGLHGNTVITQLISSPGLLLQRLTTRKPDDDQIEVAITSMETALKADAGNTAGEPDQSHPNEVHLRE